MGIWDKDFSRSQTNGHNKMRCSLTWHSPKGDVATFNKPIANPKQTAHNQPIIKK